MFGRKPRHKSLQQLGRELDELRWRNIRNVFFVDDNLIGHKAVAKALLGFLKVTTQIPQLVVNIAYQVYP
jgi:radical SAM superfamily enzyme YgiQ (UPF0313 family)